MTPKEILKEAFDSDLEVLDKAFENDGELFKAATEIISAYTSIIWTALIRKGIVTMEEYQEYLKTAQDLAKEALNKREKEGVKDENN